MVIDMWVPFCLLVLIYAEVTRSDSVHKRSNSDDIDTMLEKLIQESGSYKGAKNKEISDYNKSSTPKNNSRIVYFKTIAKPRVTFKKLSTDGEDDDKTVKVPDFLYDDLDEVATQPSKTVTVINNSSIENLKIQQSNTVVEGNPQVFGKQENKVGNANEGSSLRVNRSQENTVYPDFVIDQIVYEESESKSENFKSSIEGLERKVNNYFEKDKQKLTKLFSELKNLYNEIEHLKRVQDKLKQSNENLTRRKTLPMLDNMLGFKSPQTPQTPCSHSKKSFGHPTSQINPIMDNQNPYIVRQRPSINANTQKFLQMYNPKLGTILPHTRIPIYLKNNLNNRLLRYPPMMYKYFY